MQVSRFNLSHEIHSAGWDTLHWKSKPAKYHFHSCAPQGAANGPFPSSLVPLFQREPKCETILTKMKLHVELIFIWKVSHLIFRFYNLWYLSLFIYHSSVLTCEELFSHSGRPTIWGKNKKTITTKTTDEAGAGAAYLTTLSLSFLLSLQFKRGQNCTGTRAIASLPKQTRPIKCFQPIPTR